MVYIGTIHSIKCTGTAFTIGKHPYKCIHCHDLVSGKSSPLLRKYNRAKHLKNPRSDDLRATRKGVVHKFCTVPQIETALYHQRQMMKIHKDKSLKLSATVERMLYSKWHDNMSAYPFLETLQRMIVDGSLSDFDVSFITNWTQKKSKGQICKADEQARSLAILYSNRLGQKTFQELAPLLGLPSVRQTQKIRSMACNEEHYMPGINDWAIQKAARRGNMPLQNSMDGTRVIRAVELYRDYYLVGQEFPPDVRSYPAESMLPTLQNPKQVENYILNVRKNGQYAAEAYSLSLCDTTGTLDDVIIGCIPEAKKGVTGSYIFALMMEVEKQSKSHSLTLVGHCTDSAGNSFNALIKLASPLTFEKFVQQIRFVGLKMKGFVFYAPILREFPSIAYPCWDHSGRTSIRNLMNQKIKIVAEVLPQSAENIQKYSLATIQDLKALKAKSPSCKIRHADITPHIRQNCDATVRVISKATIEELKTHIPQANATRLYLQASLWIHEPFRNEKFDSPIAVTQSLWAGVMTWRRWRKYVELASSITLQENFISRSHYLTLELLAHSGILHQLVLYLAFPGLDIKDYNLRNTGNRGIEAMHSILRGGAVNLPITSANLTFQDFLSRLNKVNQVKQAEHSLKKIKGNSICSTKKRQITNAQSSGEGDVHSEPYQKPSSYSIFVSDLLAACEKGDAESKVLLEDLVPHLVKLLKKNKQWDHPDHCLNTMKESVKLILTDFEWSTAAAELSNSIFDEIIGDILGDCLQNTDNSDTDNTEEDEDEEQVSLAEHNATTEEHESFHEDNTWQAENQALSNEAYSIEDRHGNGQVFGCDDLHTNHHNIEQNICQSEHDQAICNMLIDSDTNLFNDEWNPKTAKTLVKSLQPFREMPSKDRRRRFAAGTLYGDGEKPSNHNVSLFEFWAISTTKLRSAHCFLIGQIIFMSHLSKACTSEIKSNPNLELTFEIYVYDHSTSSYTWNGRSGFLKACKLLIVNVTNEVFLDEENRTISFDHSKIADLQGYLPFHDDIDFEARLPKESASIPEDAEQADADPFIVDKIIKKRFNSQKSQYEFLVSWVGYTDETWELPENIPDNKIDEYENRDNEKGIPTDRPYGLRLTRKQKKKDGYIKTF